MTESSNSVPMRRRLLLAGLGLAAGLLPGASGAAARMATPRQSRGPFYPDRMPLDQDNDLTRVPGVEAPARGEITDLTGLVLDTDGKPVPGALVEIWQCDANGRYIHRADPGDHPRDPGFQGYGSTLAAADGGYRFRTIKPVPYPGRAPHIHVAVTPPGGRTLVTQLYVEGAAENDRDFLVGLLTPEERRAVTVAFTPGPDRAAPLAARFDLVLA